MKSINMAAALLFVLILVSGCSESRSFQASSYAEINKEIMRLEKLIAADKRPEFQRAVRGLAAAAVDKSTDERLTESLALRAINGKTPEQICQEYESMAKSYRGDTRAGGSRDDQESYRYFSMAMEIAGRLRDNPPTSTDANLNKALDNVFAKYFELKSETGKPAADRWIFDQLSTKSPEEITKQFADSP